MPQQVRKSTWFDILALILLLTPNNAQSLTLAKFFSWVIFCMLDLVSNL